MCLQLILSNKDFWLDVVGLTILIVTMFFGGGLVPTYLLVKELGMLNTPWAIIVPGALKMFGILFFIGYFQGLPLKN